MKKMYTKKLLELKTEFGKVTGYNNNIQKSVCFCILAVSCQKLKTEKQYRQQQHQNDKIFGINLTNIMCKIYTEKYNPCREKF